MEKIIILVIFTLAISCQLDTGFQDLTPDDGHRDHFFFNAVDFASALDADKDNVVPDTVFEIEKPDFLVNRSPFVKNVRWFSTDTFAFDPDDFLPVLVVINSTIGEEAVRCFPASHLASINLGDKAAYSGDMFWLVRIGDGWVKIMREKVGEGFFARWRYRGCGIWMEGEKVDPKDDVS